MLVLTWKLWGESHKWMVERQAEVAVTGRPHHRGGFSFQSFPDIFAELIDIVLLFPSLIPRLFLLGWFSVLFVRFAEDTADWETGDSSWSAWVCAWRFLHLLRWFQSFTDWILESRLGCFRGSWRQYLHRNLLCLELDGCTVTFC